MKALLQSLREAHSGPSGRLSSMRILTSVVVLSVMLVYVGGAGVVFLAYLRGGVLVVPDIPLGAAGLAAGALGVKAWQRGREDSEPQPANLPQEGRML